MTELDRVSVHALYRGRVLCGNLHGPPGNWPPGLSWVSAFDPEYQKFVTCPICLESVERLIHAKA